MVYLRIQFLVLVLDMLNEHFSCFTLNTHELKKNTLYSQINHTLQWYREVTYKKTTQHIHDK